MVRWLYLTDAPLFQQPFRWFNSEFKLNYRSLFFEMNANEKLMPDFMGFYCGSSGYDSWEWIMPMVKRIKIQPLAPVRRIADINQALLDVDKSLLLKYCLDYIIWDNSEREKFIKK